MKLAWDRWGEGDGPALLLIHGFSGSSHDFALHIEHLAADRPVVAFDHRGHGESSKPGELAAYSIDRLVADLAAFVDGSLGGGPVDVLGHSLGGYVAMRWALERPAAVRSLIAMDTSGWRFGDDATRQQMALLLEVFDPAVGLPATGPPTGPEQDLLQETTTEEWRAEKVCQAAAFDPYALKALGLELLTGDLPSLRDRLAAITVPATVIAGTNDEPFVGQAPDLAASFADARLELIDGAYHSPQLTHPERWRAIVAEHLARAAAQ